MPPIAPCYMYLSVYLGTRTHDNPLPGTHSLLLLADVIECTLDKMAAWHRSGQCSPVHIVVSIRAPFALPFPPSFRPPHTKEETSVVDLMRADACYQSFSQLSKPSVSGPVDMLIAIAHEARIYCHAYLLNTLVCLSIPST